MPGVIRLKKQSKYRAVPTVVDGVRFASKKEAARYGVLKALQKTGKISGLTLQPMYVLDVDGFVVGSYRGDFRYVEGTAIIIEDVKSVATKTPVYRLKKKLMRALYGIEIREI